MKAVKIKLSDLHYDPENFRLHDEHGIDAIASSLKAFGQTKPLVVQKSSMNVLAGNGTLEAMRRLGWTEADCVVLAIADERAKLLALADNRTAELGEWNEQILTEILYEMDGNLQGVTGFSDSEISKLMQDLDDSELSRDSTGMTFTCQHCGCKFTKEEAELVERAGLLKKDDDVK